jgi:ATP-dependent RNA helicase RhlE
LRTGRSRRYLKGIIVTEFSDFGLAEPLLKALAAEGYTKPTPIQAQAIPVLLSGRDLIGIAQTGTGKTAAFALPILQKLFLNRKQPFPKSARVLILSPTRELSGQIQDSFMTYGKQTRVSTALAIGGVPIGRQQRAVAPGVDVLVATPGRLLDLVNTRSFSLQHIDTLVLDEADRMLDMGFIHIIRKIIQMLPHQRQTLLFSATMPAEVSEIASKLLRDPATVAVTPVASTAEKVAQRVIHVERQAKATLLAETLKTEAVDRAIVFTRTKHGADKVVRALSQQRIEAEAIHGNKSQNHRERTLAAFRSGAIRVLIATDIAARGIDVDGISHVFNYDLPEVPETYVHRIGRTARAGADGQAIAFCDPEERPLLRAIEKLIRMTIPATGRTSMAPAAAGAPAADSRPLPRPQRPHSPRPHGDGPRNDAPRHEKARHEGPRHEGPRHEGPRQDGPQGDGARRPHGKRPHRKGQGHGHGGNPGGGRPPQRKGQGGPGRARFGAQG